MKIVNREGKGVQSAKALNFYVAYSCEYLCRIHVCTVVPNVPFGEHKLSKMWMLVTQREWEAFKTETFCSFQQLVVISESCLKFGRCGTHPLLVASNLGKFSLLRCAPL